MMWRYLSLKRKRYNGRGGKTKNDWYAHFFFYYGISPLYNTREMADYVRESFIWRQMRATRLPRALPEDNYFLFPCFSLLEAEGVAPDFELPEMVQATFYALLLNEAVELGVVHGFMAEGLSSALVGLRWSSFEV